MKRRGVTAGDVCALLLGHHRSFYPIYMGAVFLGAIPSVLAFPNSRIHPEKFKHGLKGMAVSSGLKWILTEREIEPLLRSLVLGEGSTIKGFLFPYEWEKNIIDWHGEPFHPDCPSLTDAADPCLLQHSSGTTGLQKAVVLSHRKVFDHMQRYAAAIALDRNDKVVNWLPLYHDMGLIAAFHLPLAYGIPSVHISPIEWVSAPILLLEAISREKGTLCWLPNFAYNLMADRIRPKDMEGLRLDSIRILINCSEPVLGESHRKFYQKFQMSGLRAESLGAAYAMAEATFAVTQTVPGKGARTIVGSRRELEKGIFRQPELNEATRECTSSGSLISGCDAKMVDLEGNQLEEGLVGEIAIRSASLFEGYRNNPEKTNAAFREGWFFTGDLGFRYQGEFFITGRKKDLIIVAGNNIYPEDIETIVGNVHGVIPGRVVAFGVFEREIGTEKICVVAETKTTDKQRRKEIERAIKMAGNTIEVTISVVFLVPPRWLIKSSSGKPDRTSNKERILLANDASLWRKSK